jgi:uncharacterized protein YukE
MAKAVVDPEHLNRFAGNLRHFTTDLREQSQNLHLQFTRLGDTWRDQEQAKFAEEFTQMLAALERFAVTAEAQIPVLQRKAAAIAQYLRNR